ncbi:MAG: 16S rRNA (uracil(1498)-N(3))-methyltransferase [Acidimicrobiales bacterium]|nr:16S rRNA (uracil(1498)-N(3))-methyltransferase [Acidimicrobiales bacterium]
MIDPTLRRFPLAYVEDLSAPVLSASSRRHLTGPLRLGPGDPVNVADGLGGWAPAVLTDDDAGVAVTGPVVMTPPSSVVLTVMFTPTKGVKPEWVVQKLTELGIDRIGILQTERSVVSYDRGRAERLLRKLQTVVTEACQQSRRLIRPEILGPKSVQELVSQNPETRLCDPAGDVFKTAMGSDSLITSLAIGPEGGWSPAEAEHARLVALPGGILRAETAAITAAVVLVSQ